MSWTLSALQPQLPDHCSPQNDFLLNFSRIFHTCVPTHLALLSTLLGILSIVAWLFAQLPQIYKNWSLKSTSGLSIFFLVEWCLGDVSNLLGALFTHQASWQVAIGAYYVFVDLCLVGQWLWYETLRHGAPLFKIWTKKNGRGDEDRENGLDGSMERVVIQGMPAPGSDSHRGSPELRPADSDSIKGQPDNSKKPTTRPQIIFRTPTFDRSKTDEEEKNSSLSSTPRGSTIHRVGPSSSIPSPSPRTILLIACLVAVVQASPLSKHSTASTSTTTADTQPTPLETAGTILSWISTALYLGSRLPQLYKNYLRKSTAGLSPHLFIAAFCGNLFYSTALFSNPCAWESFSAYGGRGWAGPEGSDRATWVLAALPFFLGAAGVLGLDGSVGVQFVLYGEEEPRLVVVEERSEERGGGWRWRRVEGWMRGWIPSISDAGGNKGAGEREALLVRRGAEGME